LKAVTTRLSKYETQEKRSKQELEEVRLRIASSLPHEFRTPLSGLIGFAEMLKNYKQFDDDTVNMMIDQVRGNAERLQRLVENFLLYAQIEMSALRNGSKPLFQDDKMFLTQDIINSSVIDIAARNKRTGDVQASAERTTVAVMAHYLKKIADELIDNACKFSSPGTAVIVHAAVTPDNYYTLTVKDAGRGMSAAAIESIGAYSQFDRETHEQQGMGLGLALVQRIVEGYNGIFSISSQEGVGTEVTVKLPVLPNEAE
jgi:two-component system, sensor histidine kinase and response regulator